MRRSKGKRRLLKSIESYDVYSDFEPFLFKELDRQYPDSKFILNTRDLESWLDSREKHVKRNQDNPFYKGNFIEVDRDAWRLERERHHENVLKYFKDRHNDLLVIDVCKGEGWEKLCPFLKVSRPSRDFPHENKSPDDSKLTTRKVGRI